MTNKEAIRALMALKALCWDEPYYNGEFGTALEMACKALNMVLVLEGRLKHLLQSDFIRSFDEKNFKTKEYVRDIREADSKWIPCSERLPEDEGMYLITARVYDKKEIQYAFYQKEIGLFICNGTAIAWMPLPEPYKEGEDER